MKAEYILARRLILGTKMVEALCLHLKQGSHNHCFTNEEFGQLRNLRFLQVDYTDLAGDFNHLLSKLRWLHWHRCPGNFAPTNFHLKNLVILELSYSKITDDWEVWSEIKMAKKLRVLDLSNCSGLSRTPDFSTFSTLERLILKGCHNLVQIHPSIGNLINLKVLDIACSEITEFYLMLLEI
ncbi:hypothetical protein L1049_017037 [Liquidambar formosana]|uniref:Zer-1-like leucine-rich repeats region domain-containing protein n=1 Tax=Liquidambar formosana TaxID=63359 RepID=A0AAP0X766_LIQFO